VVRRVAVLAVLAAVLVSGCAGVGLNSGPAQTGPTTGDDPGSMADPANDVIGWEDGLWHNESIDVDQSDGLSNAELERFVARGMARVEYLRDREFDSDVPVSVISREAYRNRTDGADGGDLTFRAWNEQVWEGLWIIGEDTTFTETLGATQGSSVGGFYSPSNDAITIITTTPDSPTIDNGTLIHELTHALQDQYGDLGESALSAPTQDGQLAADSVVEGEANYVEDRYRMRCGAAWECVASPGGGSGPIPEEFNFGLFVTIFLPYSDGPPWVAQTVETAGWSAIDAAFADPPASTEQIIHQTDEEPIPLSFNDRATGSWEIYPDQGVDGADTVGEASIFAMFWYQSRNYGAGVVNVAGLADTSGPYDAYDYRSEPSAGWGNDLLVPYVNESGADGYVWKTVWDTEEDAREFEDAYRQVLAAHDALERGPNTYVVPDGPFADAFRLVRNGTGVTIVNGPTVAAVDAIRPASTDPGGTTTSGETGPGFGVGVGVLALLAIGLLGARRR
jgi:PGF-CTERM protein